MKAHRESYESLRLFVKQRNEVYSDAIRESWLVDIKNKLPRQRCGIWIQYAYQLEEMESTGTISDRRLYLNRSNYDKLPALVSADFWLTMVLKVSTSSLTSGRPKSGSEYIFVRSKTPYGKLTGKVCTKALYRILPERKAVKGGGKSVRWTGIPRSFGAESGLFIFAHKIQYLQCFNGIVAKKIES